MARVCGGAAGQDLAQFSQTCWSYDFHADAWAASSYALESPRHSGLSFGLANDTWLVLGGISYQLTSEMLVGSQFVPGMDLPVPMVGACQAQLNFSHVFVAGGRDHLASAFLLNASGDGEWKAMPDMPSGRHGHVCGIAEQSSGAKVIVVAGGVLSGGSAETASALLFSLATLAWSDGPDLPNAVVDAAVLQLRKNFVVAGGMTGSAVLDAVVEFDVETEGWKQWTKTLQTGKRGHSVVKLPKQVDVCDGQGEQSLLFWHKVDHTNSFEQHKRSSGL